MAILKAMSQDARRDEEEATDRRARLLGVVYLDTSVPGEKPLFKDVLPLDEMYKKRVIPVHVDQSNIVFGITTTTSQQTMNEITQHFTDQRVVFNLISDNGFRDFMRLYNPPKQVVYQDISVRNAGTADTVQQVSDTLDKVRADDLLAYLVSQAHRLNASDVHIETQEETVRIRYRIDGVLHTIAFLKLEKYRALSGAVASAANVSTASDSAQQGHISQKVEMADGAHVDVNVRLETVPTIHGMDMVMRLFNMDEGKYNLDRLDLSDEQRKVVDEIIDKPSGLVLIVGPTGSGKTTTLYSMLNSLNSDERKIITIEDPVEYQFDGITQISVRSQEGGNDSSFADKLRATLRLDPDIVMIGEIRDNDTAKTALQASLTGHLVLSTYHAGSAAEALTRLMDVIGQNPLFVSAIRLVMAQRLIRKLDETTKVARPATEAELRYLQAVLDSMPAAIERPNLQGLQLYEPGSSAENPYGYQGQIAIREQFRMSGEIRQLLEQHTQVLTSHDIEDAARRSGMRTMLQDGILRVIAGETTMTEVHRVVG